MYKRLDDKMNERIKELIEQATTIEYGGDRGFDQVNPQATFDKEKFAELIVERCIELSDLAEKNCLHPSTIIKRHFGVEE